MVSITFLASTDGLLDGHVEGDEEGDETEDEDIFEYGNMGTLNYKIQLRASASNKKRFRIVQEQ